MDEKLQEKYIRLMRREVNNADTEVAHSNADDLLCQLLDEIGYDKLVKVYQEVNKWYA